MASAVVIPAACGIEGWGVGQWLVEGVVGSRRSRRSGILNKIDEEEACKRVG